MCIGDEVPSHALRVEESMSHVFISSLIPTRSAQLVAADGRIKSEKELIGKATQLGQRGVDDYDSADCPNTGNGCTSVFAVSIPGVLPSLNATWFQAAAACRNAGKVWRLGNRLLRKAGIMCSFVSGPLLAQ